MRRRYARIHQNNKNMQNHTKLRIVSNGKKFRIQSYVKVNENKIVMDYKLKSFFSKQIIPIMTNQSIYEWKFMDSLGYVGYWGSLLGFRVTINDIINFNSKPAAISWIKSKYGDEGLNLLQNEENWVAV